MTATFQMTYPCPYCKAALTFIATSTSTDDTYSIRAITTQETEDHMNMHNEEFRAVAQLIEDIKSLGVVPMGGPPVNLDGPLAAHLYKLGYRRQRTITTLEERDAIADRTVVRSQAGSIANVVQGWAYFFGVSDTAPVEALALPLTVLWEPEA